MASFCCALAVAPNKKKMVMETIGSQTHIALRTKQEWRIKELNTPYPIMKIIIQNPISLTPNRTYPVGVINSVKLRFTAWSSSTRSGTIWIERIFSIGIEGIRRIPMKHHVSRLKNFGLESMSDCTPQVTGVRATERIPQGSTRLLQGASFRKLEAPVKALVSGYSLGKLWTFTAGNPEPVRLDNPISAKNNSTSSCTSDFTGRVSIF